VTSVLAWWGVMECHISTFSLSRRAVILSVFKQLVCNFPTTGIPSHTRTVTTRSTSDAVKHFIKLRWCVGWNIIWVHRKWTCTKTICFAVYSGPESSACSAVRGAIAALNLRNFPLHSSPFLVFLWHQHVRSPEVSMNIKLINIICNTSRIFAAQTPTSRQNFDECSWMEVWCSWDMF